MVDRYDVVVTGGGQAGLAMSAVLRDGGRERVVLERSGVELPVWCVAPPPAQQHFHSSWPARWYWWITSSTA